MASIPRDYPFGCSTDQITQVIKDLQQAILKSGANINSVLQFSPLIALGQNEIQKRLAEQSQNVLDKSVGALSSLSEETRRLQSTIDVSAAGADKLSKVSILIAVLSLLVSIAIYPLQKAYDNAKEEANHWGYICFELEWDKETLGGTIQLMSAQMERLRKASDMFKSGLSVPRKLLVEGRNYLPELSSYRLRGSEADRIYAFYSSAELLNTLLEVYFQDFSIPMVVTNEKRFHSGIRDTTRSVNEQALVTDQGLAAADHIAKAQKEAANASAQRWKLGLIAVNGAGFLGLLYLGFRLLLKREIKKVS